MAPARPQRLAAAPGGRRLQEEFRLGAVSVEPQESEVYDRSCQTEVSGDAGGEAAMRLSPSSGGAVRPTQSVLMQAQRLAAAARTRPWRRSSRDGRGRVVKRPLS